MTCTCEKPTKKTEFIAGYILFLFQFNSVVNHLLIIAMTWRPSSASVSKARGITTRAISMKLSVRIPLGKTPRAFFDFRDLTYFVASRWPSFAI
jgi:hypothetical protein